MEIESEKIDRWDTAQRILFSLLFWLIAGVLEAVLGAVVIFELFYSLITEQAPPERVRAFANRVVSYFYTIGRYLTYNSHTVPFPFDEFPEDVEPANADGVAQLEEPPLA